MFIPSPQECVDIIGVKTDNRTNGSREGGPVERSKSREINPVVRTVEGSHVGCSNLWEINPVLRTKSYADILRKISFQVSR